MSLRFIFTRFAILIGLCLSGWVCSPLPARAQTVIERLVSPGPLSEKHRKYEKDCKACHVKFRKELQSARCLDCHKDIAKDVNTKSGLHGKSPDVKGVACKTCHTEHEGVDFDIVQFSQKGFNHNLTDYPLAGGHKKARCAQCHTQGKKFRDAPSDCLSCHKKDEPHKGRLGKDCQSCHVVADWKTVHFDHSKTRYPLLGRHKSVKCKACHVNEVYKGLVTKCIACHRKDDKHKGRFGASCEQCHTVKGWKRKRFNHVRKTGFALKGRHGVIACQACHTVTLYRPKLQQSCISCHRKDDTHKGLNGVKCEQCHSESSWKTTRFDHDHDTKFPLLGVHRAAKCEACHSDPVTVKLPGTLCIDCHRKDDKHKGWNGPKCQECHNNTDWKTVHFDHNLNTDFALIGAHVRAKCEACHVRPVTETLPGKACLSCHRKDDAHAGTLGQRCENCHNTNSWTEGTLFDHDFTEFPLLGKHKSLLCKDCHITTRFKDAPVECIECHMKDDKHKGLLGTECADCHNPNSWAHWIFDHNTQTEFALDGAHTDLSCASCHARVPANKQSRTCISCHRIDDVHRGKFGRNCSKCHTTTNFRFIKFR